MNLTFIQLIKIIFILLFILLNIYLINNEKDIKGQQPLYLQSGFFDNKLVKGFLQVLSATAGLGGLYSIATSNNSEVDKNLREIKKELTALRDQNTKQSFEGLYNKVDSIFKTIKNQQIELELQKNKLNQLNLALSKFNTTSTEAKEISKEINKYSLEIQEIERSIRSSLESGSR